MATAEVFTQRRFRCPTCRRSWSKKKSAEEHIERGCHRDPASKTCATCAYFDEGQPEIPREQGYIPVHCDVSAANLEGIDPRDFPRGCPKHETAEWSTR